MATPGKDSDASPSGPQWQVISPLGPALAYHTGCVINNVLYVHGGIDKKRSTTPLNGLHCMDLDARIWQKLQAPNSPSLSHHACVTLHNRYMVLIGGWDGKVRVCDVYAFDTQEQKWLKLKVSGFPQGAGLSSHTATLLANGDIAVIGREGSLRTHRRSGNAFMLMGNIAKGEFTYHEMPISVNSRSGHTADILGDVMWIIGGRSDKLIELQGRFKSPPSPCSLMPKLSSLTTSFKPMVKPPCGRKHHIAVSGNGVIFIHGGETFDGRSREPVGEMFLLSTKPHMQWFKLGVSSVGRAGHLCCKDANKIIIHGGEGPKGVIYADSYELML